MKTLRRCILLLCLIWAGPVLGQEEESRAFYAAARAFQDGFIERAEKSFGEFVTKFPSSPRVPEAILLQARSLYKQQKFNEAVDLLTINWNRAGSFIDEYHYWMGEIHLEDGDYTLAAQGFAQVLKEFPNSIRRLEASVGEAQALFKLRQWNRVIDLLENPDGNFQKAALLRANDDLVVRGTLLLAEAQLEQRSHAAVRSVLERLGDRRLTPELKWRSQYLLCRVDLAEQKPEVALAQTTNLLSLATLSGQNSFVAASYALQGQILEQLNRYDAAVAAYEKNQVPTMPAERIRESYLKIIELMLLQNRLAEAATNLERFFTARPADSASDVALLTLAELRLKQYFAVATTNRQEFLTNSASGTNLLQAALTPLDALLKNHPESPYRAKAQFTRGWALLAAERVPDSLVAFKAAGDLSDNPELQAVARFKVGDIHFQQGNFTNAIDSYRQVLREFGGVMRVKRELFDRAYYQILRAAIAGGDEATAAEALERVLTWHPGNSFADRSLLLFGQFLSDIGETDKARQVLLAFNQRFPDSLRAPDVALAIAQSYEQENNWSAALGEYDKWVSRFTTNDALPRVEFHRAAAHYRAGQERNALGILTNFLTRWPLHSYAARAQDWVGDFYYRTEDYGNAEKQYQLLFNNANWPMSDLKFEALFKAGRAAYQRLNYDDAIGYFTNLINDVRCPSNLVAQSYFAYGDTLVKRRADDANNPLKKYADALVIFSRIPQFYPNESVAPRALGRVAACHFELGSQDPNRYTNALAAFQRVLEWPGADVSTRSQAELGIGHVRARQAALAATPAESRTLLDTALRHYLNVVYGTLLKDAEQPDPFMVKEAGLAAARLLEQDQQWERALELYARMARISPALRTVLERKVAYAREQQTQRKN